MLLKGFMEKETQIKLGKEGLRKEVSAQKK